MKTTLAIRSSLRLSNRLKKLKAKRRKEKDPYQAKRKALTRKERDLILRKTGKRCHICGGKIKRGESWQADHVFAHAHGGKHSFENYLPAHSICNNYRWHYGAEEFQWILKLGVWTRTLIEQQNELGITLADKFIQHERKRISRRKNKSDNP